MTPQVPSTVAFGASVVGAPPAHVEELVAEERREARATAEKAAATRAAAAGVASRETQKNAATSTRTTTDSEGAREEWIGVHFRAVEALHLVKVEADEEEGDKKRDE